MTSNFEDSQQPPSDPFFTPTLQLILKGSDFPIPSYLKFYQNTSFTGTNWTLFAATDINDTQPNPLYKHNIHFQYVFPYDQSILIEVWRASIGFRNLYASVKLNLVKLLRSPTKSIELTLDLPEDVQADPVPSVKLSIDEPLECKDILTIGFSARLNKRYIFPPRTYYSLWKSVEFGPFTHVLKSPQTSGNDPIWPKIKMKVSNQFKQHGVLRVVVHDKSDKVIGLSEFSYADVAKRHKRSFDLVQLENLKDGRVEVTEQGFVEIADFQVEKVMTFNDYFTAGLDLQYFPIIDFSSFCKDKDSKSEDTCHLQQYRETIRLVTNVLGNYLGEMDIAAMGVGAKKAGYDSKDFFMLREEKKLLMPNTSSLLNAFDETVKDLEERCDLRVLPVISETMKTIKTDIVLSQKLKYYVCVLFVSGDIQDAQELIDLIVFASNGAPISFLIIEIGNKTSSPLRVFQNDIDKLTGSQGRPIGSLNVKYICLSEYANEVKAVIKLLEDVPRQIWTLLNKLDILPKNLNSKEAYNKYFHLSNFTIPDFITTPYETQQGFGDTFNPSKPNGVSHKRSMEVFE